MPQVMHAFRAENYFVQFLKYKQQEGQRKQFGQKSVFSQLRNLFDKYEGKFYGVFSAQNSVTTMFKIETLQGFNLMCSIVIKLCFASSSINYY